ncbi:hypothetical protein H310_00450 [Aphanomyces invadans]|uniref:Uncharacterized protein n=1 Tax=Aphanomyces invadans TaxID=157072 RepID=A0A024UUP8_9STRA|nr:hypothetical protein H310_00450 [Aphanomyces invadans]ETW10064.1 hypothetical protein H310_00450 [Aphanomyces invadans]|eukprot:XP_008861475.1 hypothetical protein H310_00450 [Aphanomyces invadans]
MPGPACVGPLVYRKHDNATDVSITRNCTSSVKANTTDDVWYPNTTYMQIRHGPWGIETVVDNECVSLGRPNLFVQANCSQMTFGHFTDAQCTMPLTSEPLATDVRTCYATLSAAARDTITFPPPSGSLPTTTPAVLTNVVNTAPQSTAVPTSTTPADTITAPPTSQPSTTPPPLTSNPPPVTSTNPTVTPGHPPAPAETTKKLPQPSLSSTSMASSFVWTAVGVAILVVGYRKLRRRHNNYIQLRNPGSP